MSGEFIAILDFGSQYTQLIARKVRELGVFSVVYPYSADENELLSAAPKGIILSGGPASVLEAGSPLVSKRVLEAGVPVLGICYGMQLASHLLGGKVIRGAGGEYGRARLHVETQGEILAGVKDGGTVWMSHGDVISRLPEGFEALAHTEDCRYAVAENARKKVFLLQFHPEVAHTTDGGRILDNFVRRICGCSGGWNVGDYAEKTIREIRDRVGEAQVICGVSGGVDSSVTAVIVHRAIGKQLKCVFVDHGLLRQGERRTVEEIMRKGLGIDVEVVDAAEEFLAQLKGVTDPETKRKIIGEKFIRVFEAQKERLGDFSFLAQGTLYPDVIESRSVRGPSATIKSHHNVGGLPEEMDLELIEPLRELFKDEVRRLAKILGLPETVYGRHPFPGPGLAVRILGEVDEESLSLLRQADEIFIRGLREEGLYDRVWQAFAVLLPGRSVGVMGDSRTYERVVALRAVTSSDGMTADWARLPHDFLAAVSSEIVNEVKGINRVVYDISSKPPSTIEWE